MDSYSAIYQYMIDLKALYKNIISRLFSLSLIAFSPTLLPGEYFKRLKPIRRMPLDNQNNFHRLSGTWVWREKFTWVWRQGVYLSLAWMFGGGAPCCQATRGERFRQRNRTAAGAWSRGWPAPKPHRCEPRGSHRAHCGLYNKQINQSVDG